MTRNTADWIDKGLRLSGCFNGRSYLALLRAAGAHVSKTKVDPDTNHLIEMLGAKGLHFYSLDTFDEPEGKFISNRSPEVFEDVLDSMPIFDPLMPLAEMEPGVYRLSDTIYKKDEALVTLSLDYRDPHGRALADEHEMIVRTRMAVQNGEITKLEFTAKTKDTLKHAGRPRQEFSDTARTLVEHKDPAQALALSYVLFHEHVMKHPEFPADLHNFNPASVFVKSGLVCHRGNFLAVVVADLPDIGRTATVIDASMDNNRFFVASQDNSKWISLRETGEDRELETEHKLPGIYIPNGKAPIMDRSALDRMMRTIEGHTANHMEGHTQGAFKPNGLSKVERADVHAYAFHYRQSAHGQLDAFASAAGNDDSLFMRAPTLVTLFNNAHALNKLVRFAEEIPAEDRNFIQAVARNTGAQVCCYG